MAAVMLLAGCKKTEGVAKVRIHVDGFSVSEEEFPETRAAIADYSGINAVTLAFYEGGTEVYKTTQLKTSPTNYTNFGDFECSLPMGSYTMVVVAYTTKEGSPFELTSPTQAAYTGAHVYETFVHTQSVNITNTNALDISATLSRIVTMLKVVSTDGKTDNASNVQMTFTAGGKSFNPITGLATVNDGFVNTVGISAAVGSPSTSSSCLFLNTDEQTMDVTIDVLDSDGNSISHKVVNNVPLKRNRITKLTGSLYSASAGSDFEVDTDWLTEYSMNF